MRLAIICCSIAIAAAMPRVEFMKGGSFQPEDIPMPSPEIELPSLSRLAALLKRRGWQSPDFQRVPFDTQAFSQGFQSLFPSSNNGEYYEERDNSIPDESYYNYNSYNDDDDEDSWENGNDDDDYYGSYDNDDSSSESSASYQDSDESSGDEYEYNYYNNYNSGEDENSAPSGEEGPSAEGAEDGEEPSLETTGTTTVAPDSSLEQLLSELEAELGSGAVVPPSPAPLGGPGDVTRTEFAPTDEIPADWMEL